VLERCSAWHICRLFVVASYSWTRRSRGERKLRSTKTRVDQAFLESGTGIHPPSPGAPAITARVGTQGAPVSSLAERSAPSPSLTRGNGIGLTGVRLSCVSYREPGRTSMRIGRSYCPSRTYALSACCEPLRSPARSSPASSFGITQLPQGQKPSLRVRCPSRVNVVPIRGKSMPPEALPAGHPDQY